MVPQQKSHLNNSKLDFVFVIGYYGHRSYSTFIMLIHTKYIVIVVLPNHFNIMFLCVNCFFFIEKKKKKLKLKFFR